MVGIIPKLCERSPAGMPKLRDVQFSATSAWPAKICERHICCGHNWSLRVHERHNSLRREGFGITVHAMDCGYSRPTASCQNRADKGKQNQYDGLVGAVGIEPTTSPV